MNTNQIFKSAKFIILLSSFLTLLAIYSKQNWSIDFNVKDEGAYVSSQIEWIDSISIPFLIGAIETHDFNLQGSIVQVSNVRDFRYTLKYMKKQNFHFKPELPVRNILLSIKYISICHQSTQEAPDSFFL